MMVRPSQDADWRGARQEQWNNETGWTGWLRNGPCRREHETLSLCCGFHPVQSCHPVVLFGRQPMTRRPEIGAELSSVGGLGTRARLRGADPPIRAGASAHRVRGPQVSTDASRRINLDQHRRGLRGGHTEGVRPVHRHQHQVRVGGGLPAPGSEGQWPGFRRDVARIVGRGHGDTEDAFGLRRAILAAEAASRA